MAGILTNGQIMRETSKYMSATNKTQVKLLRVIKEQRRTEHTVYGVFGWFHNVFLSKLLYSLYYKIAP